MRSFLSESRLFGKHDGAAARAAWTLPQGQPEFGVCRPYQDRRHGRQRRREVGTNGESTLDMANGIARPSDKAQERAQIGQYLGRIRIGLERLLIKRQRLVKATGFVQPDGRLVFL